MLLPNGTIAGLDGIYDTRSSYVGQISFDEDLHPEVGKNEPYTSSTGLDNKC